VINEKRRTLLKGTFAASTLALAGAAGLLKPSRVLAATQWPKTAFEAKTANDALHDLYGSTAASDSKAITIKAPIQAENGAVVPISVTSSLPNVESIAIVVEKNPNPLATQVNLMNGAAPFFSARLKMGQTSNVDVLVKSGGKLYKASQQIKVTVGGCGG
jgi:sulfur-oxidizing protein SoxY